MLQKGSISLRSKLKGDAAKPPMSHSDVEELIKAPFDGPITRNRAKKIHQGTKALLVRLAALEEGSNKKKWVTLIQHVQGPEEGVT